METLSFSAINISPNLSIKHHKTQLQNSLTSSKFSILHHNKSCLTSLASSCFCISLPRARASATSSTTTTLSSTKTENCHWMVLMERPPRGVNTKPEIIDYYVKTLKRVLGKWAFFCFVFCFGQCYCLFSSFLSMNIALCSETDAQMCIYDASCEAHFGFCCNVDEETSRELARMWFLRSVITSLVIWF